MKIIGIDIGGTKCAVLLGSADNGNIEILKKSRLDTDHGISPEAMIKRLAEEAEKLLAGEKPDRIGISCGGPLDSVNGIIKNPPNLVGWDNIPITEILERELGAEAVLQNDANACAAAEWKFGAGKGKNNIVFLTFGTGLGAGLILGGRLYSGTNDMAGEAGHIRLEKFGPVGYGKSGSFEGFCSGGGIAQLGRTLALESMQKGIKPSYADGEITAKSIADAARQGDETAVEVYHLCGQKLGEGLSVLIDLLNPEMIIIGSIFARSRDLLWKYAEEVINRETLSLSRGVCKVVPAALGESIGDYAALATAML